MKDFLDDDKILKTYEERKDYVSALKHALQVKIKPYQLLLKIGKYYRILGLPEKAIGTYICALLAHPDNYENTGKQIDACLRHIYQKYVYKSEFTMIQSTNIFPKAIGKPSAKVLRGSLLVFCDGNAAFKEFLLKIVSGRYQSPNLLKRLVLSNVSSADLLNLTRFVKIFKGKRIECLHFRENVCSHTALLLLKGLDVDYVIFENVRLTDASEVLDFKASNFIILGNIDDKSLSYIQTHVEKAYVSSFSLTSCPKISVGKYCTVLQGAISQKFDIKQFKYLRALKLKRVLEENNFSLDQLSELSLLERLCISGYALQQSCRLPFLHHLELDNFFGQSSLMSMLAMNKQIRSIVLRGSCESLMKEVAGWICDLPKLEELIVVNCVVDVFFLEHISTHFFKLSRKCLGLVDCGAESLVTSLKDRYPTKIIFHDSATFEMLRARAWPETQVEFYYKE